jgi:hypothetical protein
MPVFLRRYPVAVGNEDVGDLFVGNAESGVFGRSGKSAIIDNCVVLFDFLTLCSFDFNGDSDFRDFGEGKRLCINVCNVGVGDNG